MRYERKYRIATHSYDRVYHEMMSNLSGFSKVYEDRIINSIYYDDINYSAYNDNLLGIADRVKYRVRWYGESLSSISNPILEKKIKKGLLGTKEYFDMTDFNLDLNAPDINSLVCTNHLYPQVVIRYRRTYLESFDRKIRATIDRDLQYFPLNEGKRYGRVDQDQAIILEVKYDQADADTVLDSVQAIPYRLTKNSKYVCGMQMFLK